MTSVLQGLASINKFIEKRDEAREARASSANRTYFQLKDKESAKVIFLQELDADSPNYSEKRGLGALITEHSSPKDFKKKALCSIDSQGACYACEQHEKDRKAGWGQKNKLYINVLVLENTKGAEPHVALLNQGMGSNSITQSLIEQATEIGTITDKEMKIKRNGSGFNDTSYVLTPLGQHSRDDLDSLELTDVTKAVREIPYNEQEEFYGAGSAAPVEEVREASKPAANSGYNETW